MIRAGVFIGVDKTGGLHPLNDAANAAERMHGWSLAQGITDRTHAKLITDKAGRKVAPDMIYDAIKELIDGPGVDQLIVYFSGHGVNLNRGEHWLLSDAPVKTNAAVDMTASVDLARFCGIGHVVFISDACRVAANGIQAQRVRGSDIFPNLPTIIGSARPVDQFFACALGSAAAEVQDPNLAARSYSALYTDALLDCLKGHVHKILEPAPDPADMHRYVKPQPLAAHLKTEVPQRLKQRKLDKVFTQAPDDLILAHSNWISRLIPPALSLVPPISQPPTLPPTANAISRDLVASVILNGVPEVNRRIGHAKARAEGDIQKLAKDVERFSADFGPDHFESQCGFKVRGADLIATHSKNATVNVLSKDLVRVDALNGDAASVLLQFRGESGTVLPAFRGYLGALTFENGELVDLSYEPSTNSPLWSEYQKDRDQVRTLHGIAASAVQNGRFRLDSAVAFPIARQLQFKKYFNPAFAVYAAYAYNDLQAMDPLREMSHYLYDRLHVGLFDVALTGRELVQKSVEGANLVPFVPLLAQGWSLLRAQRVELPAPLNKLEATLLESLWSLYDAKGVELLLEAMMTRNLR